MSFFILNITLLFSLSLWAFTEEPLEFQASDGLEIHGTLSLPDKLNKPLPALLLLHGSGPLDRDSQIPGNSTSTGQPAYLFRTIAQKLSDAGYIVYRYDKRGVSFNPDGPPNIDKDIYASGNVKQLIADGRSALNTLAKDSRVNANKILLLGLSEGTILAPLVAEKEPIVAGLVLMSAAGRNLKDIIQYQFVDRNIDTLRDTVDENHDGFINSQEIDSFPEVNLPIPLIDQNNDDLASLAEIKAFLWTQFQLSLDAMLGSLNKVWYEQHFALEPNYKTLTQFKGPILILQGEIDAQTPLEEALLLQSHLIKTKHQDFKLVTFPGLGHGFSPPTGKKNIVPTVGPINLEVIDELISWLQIKNED